MKEQLGNFSHELRNLLGTATLAFTAAKEGNHPLTGATGNVLERSLTGLSKLIDRSLAEVRLWGVVAKHQQFSLSKFIEDIKQVTELDASARDCRLLVSDVDPALALSADRDLLSAAVGNLLQNAFKFTLPSTEVSLNAYADGDRILIDVSDHCGGLAPGGTEKLFSPFYQRNTNKSGLGMGLSIARCSVESSGGILSVRDVPGTGCVFTVSLPRFAMK